MRRATDKVEYKNLIAAGFKVKPDVMWNHTLQTDAPDPYLSDYSETVEKTSTMFICRAWSLTLLIESVPKFTACGWFAIKYHLRSKCYIAGYVDDEGAFVKSFGSFDLVGAIVDLLLFTLNNSVIVAMGQKYLEGGCAYQDIVDSMAEVDMRPKNSYNPADRQEGTPFPDPLLISDNLNIETMDNEKLQRANELVEAIKEIEEFLKAFPNDSKELSNCQIRVLYNFSPKTERKATIIADRIPAAFQNLRASAMVQLAQYKKEFEEL